MIVTALMPLVFEVERTITDAFGNEKFDLKYYKNKVQGRVDEFYEQAAEMAEALNVAKPQDGDKEPELQQKKQHFCLSLFFR